MEHMDSKSSRDSELKNDSLCSIRTRSRSRDIVKKQECFRIEKIDDRSLNDNFIDNHRTVNAGGEFGDEN